MEKKVAMVCLQIQSDADRRNVVYIYVCYKGCCAREVIRYICKVEMIRI